MNDGGATAVDRSAYDELAAYTHVHGDPGFIHQHVVDAFAAQHATEASKPIGVAFALIGLCLHVERGRTGREVQRAHMRLGRIRREWPTFDLPADRGTVTIHDVLAATPGPARDGAIHAWCASVWQAWVGSRDRVVELLRALGE